MIFGLACRAPSAQGIPVEYQVAEINGEREPVVIAVEEMKIHAEGPHGGIGHEGRSKKQVPVGQNFAIDRLVVFTLKDFPVWLEQVGTNAQFYVIAEGVDNRQAYNGK